MIYAMPPSHVFQTAVYGCPPKFSLTVDMDWRCPVGTHNSLYALCICVNEKFAIFLDTPYRHCMSVHIVNSAVDLASHEYVALS